MTVRRRIHWIKLAWILAPALVACASVADSATDPNSAAEQGFEIAFESDRGGSSDVWVLTGKGKQHPLTGGGSVEAQPSPAPSPQQGVASYMSDRDGDFDIYAETRNGTVQVTNHPAPDYAPAWTPDGTRIAFVSERFGSKDVFVASVEPGVSFQRLTSSPNADTDPAWAPNSVRIALASNRAGTYDIWFFDLGSKHRLTHNGANDFEPAFSPSGGRVAFTRRNKFGNYDIYVIQANGNGLMRLTTNAAEDSEPTWSPDGEQIAFVSNRGGSYDIFIMNADGTGQTNFSQSPGSLDVSPAWKAGDTPPQTAATPETTLGGVTCTRLGTNRGERIFGTPSADVICGMGGNDTIFALGGNDIISGGGGKDTIKGGPGKDRILARDGRKDKLFGGNQNDRGRTDGSPFDKRNSVEAQF